MLDPSYGILTVVFPLVGATFALAAKAIRNQKAGSRLGPILETLGAVIALAFPLAVLALTFPSIYAQRFSSSTLGGWSPGVGIAFSFDGLSWLLDFLAFSIAACAYVYSRGAGPRSPAFSLVFFVLLASLAATAGTEDLFNLFVCLELSGLASYILIASSSKSGSYLAAFRYLALSSAAMGLFLIGLYGLYRLTGSLSYEGIAQGLAKLASEGVSGGALFMSPPSGVVATFSIACIVTAMALRFAVFPLHGWLPGAHSQAPHAVSAMLSGVLLKTPLFALGRFLTVIPQGGAGSFLRPFLGVAGAITALVAVIAALAQKDAKRLLAYSSISQIGYVLVAWGASSFGGGVTELGMIGGQSAAYQHAIFHGLFKSCLFLTVGTICDLTGSRDVYSIRGAAQILHRRGDRIPVLTLSYLVAALSIVAVPPLNGYASKAAISSALHSLHGAPWANWAYILLLVTGVGTVASYLKLSMIFFPSPRKGEGRLLQKEELALPIAKPTINLAMRLGVALLAVACVASAVFAPRISAIIAGLLGEATPSYGGYLAPKELGKSAIILVAGGLVFALALTKPGKAVAAFLRRGKSRFSRMTFSLVFTLCLVSIFLMIRT